MQPKNKTKQKGNYVEANGTKLKRKLKKGLKTKRKI